MDCERHKSLEQKCILKEKPEKAKTKPNITGNNLMQDFLSQKAH